jgi:hypothetical protein
MSFWLSSFERSAKLNFACTYHQQVHRQDALSDIELTFSEEKYHAKLMVKPVSKGWG